jgi:hypothetical protein
MQQTKEVPMSMLKFGRRNLATLVISVIVAATFVLTGCSQSGSETSSAKHYDSMDSLAADSTAIVVGTVTKQYEKDGSDASVIVSEFKVTNSPANPSLGNKVHADSAAIVVGDTILVRQSKEEKSRLQKGDEYLLFVAPSTAEGSTANDFSITGTVAGLYHWNGTAYSRVVKVAGDTLPDTISKTS